MLGDEGLVDAHIGIREFFFRNWERLFVLVSFLQVFAIERALQAGFTLFAAADRANVAADRGTRSPGAALAADLAQYGFRHWPQLHYRL